MEKRVIKFRAWDNRRKRMMQPFISFEKHPGDGLVTEKIDWHDDSDTAQEWDTSNQVDELLQFTGLLDKNGKEIYEGDIVRLLEANRLYTVEFLEFCYKLVHADPKLQRMMWGPLNRISELNFTIEVVGHIYQNPELMKDNTPSLEQKNMENLEYADLMYFGYDGDTNSKRNEIDFIESLKKDFTSVAFKDAYDSIKGYRQEVFIKPEAKQDYQIWLIATGWFNFSMTMQLMMMQPEEKPRVLELISMAKSRFPGCFN